jgi:probable HAF family extracellular repeat protein
VLWENGEIVVLPTLEGGSVATTAAVNEEGTIIVGSSGDADHHGHAVMWVRADTSGSASPSAAEYQYGNEWEITDLGRLDGQYAGASDVNESGLIVGYMQDASGDFHGFVWDNGEHTLLPPLAGDTSTYASAINDGGQIVGTSYVPSPYAGRAVMWTQFTDPADMLVQLAADVADLGPGTSLAATVAAAQAALARDNTNATCEILQAFINQVEAQAGKKIPPATATQLIADATEIRDTIGC